MIRFLLRLLNIRDYEVCPSCQTLKEQLAYEREEKQRLIETLINIINPKVIEQQTPVEIQPISISSGRFARTRAELEKRDADEARIKSQSKLMGRPDNAIKSNVEDLEKELGIEEEGA